MKTKIFLLIASMFLFTTIACDTIACDTIKTEKKPMTSQEQKLSKYKKEIVSINKDVEGAKKYLEKETDDDSACQTMGEKLGNPIQRILREDIERQYGNYILASDLGLMTSVTNDTLNDKYYPLLQKHVDRALSVGRLSTDEQKDISNAIMLVVKQGTKTVSTEMIKKSLNKMEREHLTSLKKMCICPQCDFSVQDHPHVKDFFKQDNGIYRTLCEKLQHNVEWYCKQRRKRNCAYEMDKEICFLWAPDLLDELKNSINHILE